MHNPFKRNVRIGNKRKGTKIIFAAAFDGKRDRQLSYSEVQALAKGPIAAVQSDLDAELARPVTDQDSPPTVS